jgi:hypothetical protein
MSVRLLVVATCIPLMQVSWTPQDLQLRADAFLEQARKLEDIRSSDAPGFRLSATFSFVGDDLEPVQGTYTETWISNSKWRQETVVGEQRSIAVGGTGKQWVFVPEGFPEKADKLPILMTFLPTASLKLEFDSISEFTKGSLNAECAFTKSDANEYYSAFCFEKQSGLMLEKVSPERRPRNEMSFSCNYSSFRNFGQYMFPREVACHEDQHNSIRARVVDLSLFTNTDASLFEPPVGAVELPECAGKIVRPYMLSEGPFHQADPDRVSWTKVWFVVDKKGAAKNIRALRSLDKSSYQKAMNATRALRFTPGTCDGKPMDMAVTLQVRAP